MTEPNLIPAKRKRKGSAASSTKFDRHVHNNEARNSASAPIRYSAQNSICQTPHQLQHTSYNPSLENFENFEAPDPVHFSLITVQNRLSDLRRNEPTCVRKSNEDEINLAAATVVSSSSQSPTLSCQSDETDCGLELYAVEPSRNFVTRSGSASYLPELLESTRPSWMKTDISSHVLIGSSQAGSLTSSNLEYRTADAENNEIRSIFDREVTKLMPDLPCDIPEIQCRMACIIARHKDADLPLSSSIDSLDDCLMTSGLATYAYRGVNSLSNLNIVDGLLMDVPTASEIVQQGKEIIRTFGDSIPLQVLGKMGKHTPVEVLTFAPSSEYSNPDPLSAYQSVATVTARREDDEVATTGIAAQPLGPLPAVPVAAEWNPLGLGTVRRRDGHENELAALISEELSNESVTEHSAVKNTGTATDSHNEGCFWQPSQAMGLSLRSSYCAESSRKRYGDSVLSISEGIRPMPCQSSFDQFLVSSLTHAPSPCMSAWESPVKDFTLHTHMRTPMMAASLLPHTSSAEGFLEAPMEEGTMPLDSLTEAKVLLTLSRTPATQVCFYRDFEQEGFLGSGASADVYRARERGGDRSYAIKKIKKQFRSEKDRSVMMSEAMAMKRVGEEPCAYIVQLVRAWQEDAHFFVQIDFAERGSLLDLVRAVALRGDCIRDATVWHILHDVCAGLRHIQKYGVVHLDIKPANLLISMEGTVKIGDFGLAVLEGSGEDSSEGDDRYMAKELLSTSPRYPPADMFSLGLTLYEVCMLSEHRNKASEGLSSLPSGGPEWHLLRDGDAPPLPGRADALSTVIRAAMNPRPCDRPSAQSVLAIPQVVDAMAVPCTTLQTASAPTAGRTLNRAKSFVLTAEEYEVSGSPPSFRMLGSRDSAPVEDTCSTPCFSRGDVLFGMSTHSATNRAHPGSEMRFTSALGLGSPSHAMSEAEGVCGPYGDSRMSSADSALYDCVYEGSILDDRPSASSTPRLAFR